MNQAIQPQPSFNNNYIFTIRGLHVMLDRDIAQLYSVETKVLNQAVKRNLERFPLDFRFQLTQVELFELVTICDRFNSMKHSSILPYAFTEQGIAMLSAVLRSPIAIKISIEIIQAFVSMRKTISKNSLIYSRLDALEQKQLVTDTKFNQLFDALQSTELLPKQGVFFDGEVYDAYYFVTQIIEKAKKSIILIDSYIDGSVLTLLSKRKPNVQITIYTNHITPTLRLDEQKFNQQYSSLKINELKVAHDRFLIIDNEQLYHIGASLKDLGKKWCAFSRMENQTSAILNALNDQYLK